MSKKVFQKLLRSPGKVRKSDLLSDHEYRDLSTTCFEEYYGRNFNTEGLRTLTTAEARQLEMFYLLREKKAERLKKRTRDKPQRTVVPPVIVRIVPGPDIPRLVEGIPAEDAPQDSSDIRHLVDNIERRMAEEPVQPDTEVERSVAPQVQQEVIESSNPVDEIERALDVSMNQIDLSKAMPPKELLLEELPAELPAVPLGTIEDELDLGPPGDAAAFFGVDHPMPVSDRTVLERLRQEFPSLARPSIAGWFEELEVAPLPAADPMPPPTTGVEISSSTPIVPNPNIRRFYKTDLSAIKAPTVASEQPRDKEKAQQVEPIDTFLPPDTPVTVPNQDAPQAVDITADSTVSEPVQVPTLEPVQDAEPIPVPQVEPVPQLVTPAVPSVPAPAQIESSSSEGPPLPRPRRTRNIFRKVPTYTENYIPVTMKFRTVFEVESCENLELYEQSRALIQFIIDSRLTGTIQRARLSAERLSIRPSLANDIEENPVMRDVSATQAELSSIREQGTAANQSKLYSIQERPQREELEEQQLQGVPISVPIGETTLPSLIEPDQQCHHFKPSISLEVPLDATGQTLDTGLGNQMLFPDSSVNISAPQIIITDTSTSSNTGNITGMPPSVTLRPATERRREQVDISVALPESVQVVPGQQEAPQQNGRPRDEEQAPQPQDTSHNKLLIALLKLYFTLQHEMANTKQNAVTVERLAQITKADRMASARHFKNLLTLKLWGFFELETGDLSQLSKILLR